MGLRLAFWLVGALVALLAACGARSELDVPPLRADAAAPMDAAAPRDAATPIDAAVVVETFVPLDAPDDTDAFVSLACDGLPLPRLGAPSSIAAPPRIEGLGVAIPDPEGVLIIGGSRAFGDPSDQMAFVDLGRMTGVDIPIIGEPIAVDDPAAAYDPLRDQVIVVGGARDLGREPVADAFSVTGEGDPGGLRRVVTRRIASYPPGGVRGLVVAHDPVNDRIVAHGGTAPGGALASEATYVLDLATETWRELLPAAESPPGGAITIGYDPRRRRMIELTTSPGATSVEVHALVLERGRERWSRIGTLDFSTSVRGLMTWDDRACGFHLLSARRTRCVLEHWILVINDDSVDVVMQGELDLEPGHFRPSAPFFTTSNRIVLVGSSRCRDRGLTASTQADVVPVIR